MREREPGGARPSPPKQDGRSQEGARSAACVRPALGGWGDWQSGGVVAATQAVNVSGDCRLRQMPDAGTVQGGDT